jgi:16S rRNA (adenine1518-N6/adenine1519-N6)-dimethyltransferase
VREPRLIDIIRRHGLEPKRSLGQNFLLDRRLIERIALATGRLAGVNVIEIGPGPGGLTRALLEAGASRVVAVERDHRCLAALAELAAEFPGRLHLIEGDALTIDPATLVPSPRRIIANLPYNIATPLLIRWLRQIGEYEALGLMFQKEVAQRLTASPRSKAYGRLSILTQWLTQPSIAFDVPPGAFLPAPSVVSSVVHLVPRAAPMAECRFDDLERTTAAAFGQRRKMLRSSLKSLDGDPVERCLAAGIDATKRAEELTVPEFCALARTLGG